MSISFTCPHCGLYTDVAEQFAGMSGPCSGCGRPVTIPSMSEWTEQNPPTASSGRGAVGLAVGGLAAVMLCVGAMVLLLPWLLRVQTRSRIGTTDDNLKTIALAMQTYHEKWQSFPPAITYGPNGAPYHSWRVLLLPYLEREDLYLRYNFNVPWDNPGNQALLSQLPDVYAGGSGDASGNTRFVVVTGDVTMFPLQATTSRADARDGQAETILVVESAFSSVPWTAPQDLAYDSMSYKINDPQGACISGEQGGGAMVAMVDGTTQWLSDSSTSDAQVQSKLVRDDATSLGTSFTTQGTAIVYAPPTEMARKFSAVGLADAGNQRIDEDFHGDSTGNNLEILDQGGHLLGGVPFEVGERVMSLAGAGAKSSHLPERIEGIPVDRRCQRLHFLHATGWTAPKDGTPIGYYRINYEDKSSEMVPIEYGRDVRDWWDTDGSKPTDRGKLVWTGQNQAAMALGAGSIRLYMSTWENPYPDRKIATIDYVSYTATDCAPFCVAITIDNAEDFDADGPGEPEAAEENASSKTTDQTERERSSTDSTTQQSDSEAELKDSAEANASVEDEAGESAQEPNNEQAPDDAEE